MVTRLTQELQELREALRLAKSVSSKTMTITTTTTKVIRTRKRNWTEDPDSDTGKEGDDDDGNDGEGKSLHPGVDEEERCVVLDGDVEVDVSSPDYADEQGFEEFMGRLRSLSV